MAGRLSESVLEDILSRIDIVEVISGYIPLKRAGRNFRALCPFHLEKTPSFMVSPDRQIYHCFGCGAGGNAFGFLIQYERLEFLEAVEVLAKKAGVTLPDTRTDDHKTTSLTTHLHKINELATLFYEGSLKTPAAATARSYLIKRGIREETIKTFKVGYASAKWDGLIIHLRAKDISLSLLEKAGLVLPKENGGYYDRFRNRIMFPIFDIKLRTLGFGARLLPEQGSDDQETNSPKYVNSPETPVYTKGKNLYGLAVAKDEIRQSDCAVIVEGYMDFLMPFQEGIRNIVASLGTALTAEQARLIKRYTHNVVIVYDGDDAGQIATLRSLDIFVDEGMQVKVVSLPQGFDPDSFVRKYGIDTLREKIQAAESLFDYKLEVLKKRYASTEIEDKAKIASEMLSTINRFKNAIVKREYIKRLSQELDVAEEDMLQELKKVKEDKPYTGVSAATYKKPHAVNPAEKLLVKLMLEETALIERIRDSLEPADFQDERICKIVSILFDLAEQGKHIETNSLINYFSEDTISQLICESALLPEVSSQNRDRAIDDCIQRLKQDKLKLKKQDLHREIEMAQRLGDEERLHKLMQEFQHLTKVR